MVLRRTNPEPAAALPHSVGASGSDSRRDLQWLHDVQAGLGNWARLIIWLVIGLVVYFTYGQKHSRVQAINAAKSPEA